MNREILFRAKAINRDPDREYRTNYKNGDWVYGLITEPYNDRYDLPMEMKNTLGVSGIEVDYKTLGQYTGLTDIIGKKIFEGDIVKTSLFQTAFNTDKFHVEFVCGNFYICREGTVGTLRSWIGDVEVIGNIYDNPELLSEGG